MKTAEFLRRAAESIYTDQEASVVFRSPDSRPSYIDDELGDALEEAFTAELNGNQDSNLFYINAGIIGRNLYESIPTLKITASQRKSRALNGAISVISFLAAGEEEIARVVANDLTSDPLVPEAIKVQVQGLLDPTEE